MKIDKLAFYIAYLIPFIDLLAVVLHLHDDIYVIRHISDLVT